MGFSETRATVADWSESGCACALCAASAATDETVVAAPADEAATASGEAPTVEAAYALVSGASWGETALTFSFPDAATDFSYNWYGEAEGFGPTNAVQQAAARAGLAEFAAVSGLSFTELSSEADAEAHLTFAENAYAGTAYAYFPSIGDWGGDVWLNPTSFDAPQIGDYAYATILHEIGHALGLKHGHETGGAGPLPAEFNSHEYSLMTYSSYLGSPATNYTNEPGGGPQTLMMFDIAAIQTLYGANFDHEAGDTVYRFTPSSGAMEVNGVVGPAPVENRIFRTIWDGGGEDLYDFSAYQTDLAIDLTPGGFIDLDQGGQLQRARLGADAYARGHVFNALLFDGDVASLIEHAAAGAGDDALRGNDGDNQLSGGAGDDTLTGGGGADSLTGGAGSDEAVFDGAFDAFTVEIGDGFLHIQGAGEADMVFDSIEFLRFDDALFSYASLATGTPEPLDPEAKDDVTDENASVAPIQTEEDAPAAQNFVDADARAEADLLIGGAEADLLTGGAEADHLTGGAGADELRGGGGADTLIGGTGADQLYGGGGRDLLKGGGGADTLNGGGGRDTLNGRGGADHLEGGGGADQLNGDGGRDVLEGGGGRDLLSGGRGRDMFVFKASFGRDQITDFNPVTEKLDFSDHARVDGFADLRIVQSQSSTLIFDGAGGRIELLDVNADLISARDFIF